MTNAPESPTADLRTLAKAATPGPWHIDRFEGCYIWGPKMEMVADNQVDDAPPEEGAAVARIRGVGGRLPIAANMAFIAAANPKAVLRLLAEVDRLKALVRSMGGAA